jgi:hypothetical protein
VALGVALIFDMTVEPAAMAAPPEMQPAVDPDVRTQVAAGQSRVLVEVRVPPERDPTAQLAAIARAQDAVLARVPAILVRRYQSVPLLALEIDAAGLRALEGLGDVVVRVQPDRPMKPQ